MVLRTFHLYKILGDLNRINKENIAAIVKKLTNFKLEDVEPNRYGFDFINNENDYIYGVFTQEFEKSTVDYNQDDKREDTDITPFEDYVFIFILNTNEGIIALELKRITGQQGLMAKTRENFEKTISEILIRDVPSFKGLEPYIYKLTRDEIIKYFKENKIVEIRVKDLKNSKVPEDLKFFNPDFDLDKLNKSWWDDDFKYIDEENIKGEDLQKTKAGKAAVYTGKPKSLTMQDKTGVKTIQSEMGPTEKLPIDNYDEKKKLNVERTVEFLKTKMWKMTQDEQDEYQRTLEDF